MNLVLDASMACAWCFPDERTEASERLLEQMGEGLAAIAPRVFGYEVRNVVLKGLRRGRIAQSDATTFLKLLSELRIELLDPEDYDDIFRVARSFDLNIYDAAYFELALRRKLSLATLDIRLRERAAEAGIPAWSSPAFTARRRPAPSSTAAESPRRRPR